MFPVEAFRPASFFVSCYMIFHELGMLGVPHQVFSNRHLGCSQLAVITHNGAVSLYLLWVLLALLVVPGIYVINPQLGRFRLSDALDNAADNDAVNTESRLSSLLFL